MVERAGRGCHDNGEQQVIVGEDKGRLRAPGDEETGW